MLLLLSEFIVTNDAVVVVAADAVPVALFMATRCLLHSLTLDVKIKCENCYFLCKFTLN